MDSIEQVVELFSTLPTIGKKTARRLAFHLLKQSEADVERFSQAILQMRAGIQECEVCCTFTDSVRCSTCASTKRNTTIICVVEQPTDVMAIERTGDYRGVFHVLHGALNPLDGIGPDDIRLKELIARLTPEVSEIILALNPTVEGEVTTQYIAKMASPLSIKTTRIARGVPVGADLEFADEATLARAIEGRMPV